MSQQGFLNEADARQGIGDISGGRNPINDNRSARSRALIVFLINAAVVFLTYGIFLQLKFTMDTYSHISASGQSLFDTHMSTGRPLAAVITLAMSSLGIVDGIHQIPYALTLILVIAFCSTVLFVKLDEAIECNSPSEYILAEIAALIPFINVFFVSWFMYTEASILMGLGAVFAFGAAYCTVQDSIGKKLLGFVFLILSINLYQVFMELYVALAILFILLKHKIRFNGQCLKEIIITLCIAVLGIIANMGVTSLICKAMNIALNERTASLDINVIMDNIRKILVFQRALWIDGLNMLPDYTLLIFAALLVGILVIAAAHTRRYGALTVCMWAAVILGLYILVYSPHLVSPVFWPAERTLFVLFSVFGVIVALITMIKPGKAILTAATVVCACFMVLSIVEIQDIASDQQITNALDEEYAHLIDAKIRAYEATTGQNIAFVGIVEDTAPTWGYYSQVDKIIFDTNVTAKAHEWCYYPMLKYYTNRDYQLVNVPDDVYEAHFAEKNWNNFNPDEQIVFDGETVYICGY